MSDYIQRAELESRIKDFIWETNKNSVIFNYAKQSAFSTTLEIITVNQKLGHSFLLLNVDEVDEVAALNKALSTLRENKHFNYKVIWYKPNCQPVTSHFAVNNGKELFDKIYFDNASNLIIIKSIELLPES